MYELTAVVTTCTRHKQDQDRKRSPWWGKVVIYFHYYLRIFLAIDDFFEIVEIICFKNLATEKQAMTQ